MRKFYLTFEDDMKLLRYGETGYEKPGLMDNNGDIRDLSSVVGDITGEILEDGKLSELKGLDPTTLPLVSSDTRLGPCVGKVGKLMCIGLNYADHAAVSYTHLTLPTSDLV